MKTLFHDSHEHIDGYSDPDLGFHSVFGGTVERFDSQVLLDPFEEQLDLPSALVELRDGRGRQGEVVGKEDQTFVCFGVKELYPSDLVRVILGSIEAGEDAYLIADQAACFIDLTGIHSPELGVALGPDNEEGLREMDLVESCEVEVSTIHDVEGTGIGKQVIEDVDVMDLAVGDEGECRNTSSQIEQSVEFDCGFCLAEVCPGEKRQAQVDGGGIKRIDGLFQLKAKVVFGIELSCLGDQHLGKIGIDAPVPFLIGFGQSASCDTASNAHMITPRGDCSQTGFDITQTLAVSQLGEGHAEILVPAGECLDVPVPIVSFNTSTKVVHGQEIHELCKDDFPEIHWPPPTKCPGEYGRLSYEISNR